MSQSQLQKFLGAARTGDCAAVKLLLPFVDPSANESAALRLSSVHGHVDIVKLLLPLSDPKARKSEALRYATQNGHLDIFKLLLPLSDPKSCEESLLWAAQKGNLEMVKLLLPLSDPKSRGSMSIQMAALRSYIDIIDVLYQVSDVKNVLRGFQKNGRNSEGISYLERRFKADQDKAFLESGLLSRGSSKGGQIGIKKM